ncbi:MAG TPA: restriction endonuclease subunit S [Candidatus Acutalibacter stercoravium]|nr:restriction endonuclease subunit S [Candidatus Acutalibacter stercoravium]
MSWEKVKLGEISFCIQPGPFGSQLHNSDYAHEGTPIIMPKDMVDGHIRHTGLIRVPEEHVARLQRHQVCAGNLMVARKGDVRKCVYITENENGWLTGSDCLKVALNENVCFPKYIYYQLRSPYIGRWLEQISIGATMPSINTGLLSGIEMYLPSLEIQRRIADILSAYDDLIENNRKQIKLLEEAAQRLYKEWFVDLRFPGHVHTKITDGVPEGWKRRKLVDIAQVQYGYAFDGSLFNSQKIGTPIIRIRNIPQGQTEDYTPENVDSQYLVYNGDIIVGMDGEFHINTWAGDTAYLVQRTCRIKALTSDLNGFLLWAIYEPIKYFEKTVVGATVAHLGKKHIDTVEILVPTEKFYLPFKSLFEARLLLMNQNRALAEARDRLLPKLMSGEVEV